MHFQKALDTFQALVERLEKEINLQEELISHLQEQNAILHEHCCFLENQLEDREQRTGK